MLFFQPVHLSSVYALLFAYLDQLRVIRIDLDLLEGDISVRKERRLDKSWCPDKVHSRQNTAPK